MTSTPTDVKVDEAHLTALLRRIHGEDSRQGGPNAWAFIPQVRNEAGANATRTLDAIAIGLWPSRGLEAIGYEIKCSRSDVVAELRNPAKSEAFIPYLDRFYLVTATDKMIDLEELPESWGWMSATGGQASRLKTIKIAPKRAAEDVLPMSRGMIAALTRQAGVVAGIPADEIMEAERDGFLRGQEYGLATHQRHVDHLEQQLKDFRKTQKDFLEGFGVDMHTVVSSIMKMSRRGEMKQVGELMKAALKGDTDLEHLRGRVDRLSKDAKTLGEQAERIRREHGFDT